MARTPAHANRAVRPYQGWVSQREDRDAGCSPRPTRRSDLMLRDLEPHLACVGAAWFGQHRTPSR